MLLINPIDILALCWFVFCWAGYTWGADHRGPSQSRGLSQATAAHREIWMRRMLERENRIVDSTLLGNLMRSVAFFASTTTLIIGGLVASLGAAEQAISIVQEIPFAAPVSPLLWKAKLLLLVLIFIYAFFKFTWSTRQFNYCNILIGAAPMDISDTVEVDEYACRAAHLLALAGENFNRGLRAYYFGLAVLSWFINPWLFMAVSGWVVLVLYRREFASRTLKALTADEKPDQPIT
ncbi:MAG: DUF599 domain-containing protein [Candidatus Competibacteraceae bacterium]|jgi:uncharacterized membrane protein|nr:DUF599 domain-containing protein [Candidatus Competibacteraceae bacterium]